MRKCDLDNGDHKSSWTAEEGEASRFAPHVAMGATSVNLARKGLASKVKQFGQAALALVLEATATRPGRAQES